MTLIDSSYIQWCLTCGAALMPENMVIHAEWHGKVFNSVRLRVAALEDQVKELDARLAEAQEAVTVVERMVVSEVEAREVRREGRAGAPQDQG